MSLLEPSLFVPHPDDYVRGALKKVGMTSPCCGYWSHEVQVDYFRFMISLFSSDSVLYKDRCIIPLCLIDFVFLFRVS